MSLEQVDWAMRRNLLCEHRISAQRLAAFQNQAGPLTDIRLYQQALEDYQKGHVRPLKGVAPAYERSDNASNVAALRRGASLATVLDLTQLGPVYAEAYKEFKIPQFEKYEVTGPDVFSEINEFLRDRIRSVNRDSFLDALFRAIARYRRSPLETRTRPTWAARWDSLKPFLDPRRPAQWLHAVGVPKDRKEGTWLAVVKYRPKGGKRGVGIFRPTQYDAGWYAHHFPSPPQALEGGHTMFLHQDEDTDGEEHGLVTEYLHQRIDFTIKHWRAAGSLVGFVAGPVGGDLELQRNRHWNLLESVYGTGVKLWMPDTNAKI